MGQSRILIIEDEQRLSELLRKQLTEAGYLTTVALDGYLGKQLAEQNQYDLILLDINLPIINGYDLCREIRKTNTDVPILMLTAFSTAENKLTGFDAGADDYIVKPFDLRELLARINVFLRRTDLKPAESEKLTIADLQMDVENKTVTRAGKKIDLTAKESLLLETFLRNKGKLLSRDFIIEKVWGIEFDPNTNIIDVYVNYLRKKMDKDFDLKLLHTKFGFGFYISETEI